MKTWLTLFQFVMLTVAAHAYYHPATGKFLSRDPLAEQGGVNLTGAFNGDPVNNVDPLGLDAFIVIHGITGQEVDWSKEFMVNLKSDWANLNWKYVQNADDRKKFKELPVTWNNPDDEVPNGTVASLIYDWTKEGLEHNRSILRKAIEDAREYTREHPNEKIHLIAHSQGTVIALDTLLQLGQEFGDEKVFSSFITMGSPLGAERDNWIDTRLGNLPDTLRKAKLDLTAVEAGGWLNIYNPKDLVDRLNLLSKNISWRGQLGGQFTASGVPPANLEAWGRGNGEGIFGPHQVYWTRTRTIATWAQTHSLKETSRTLDSHPEEVKEGLKQLQRRAWLDSLLERIIWRGTRL